MENAWAHFPHEADIGLSATASDKASLFEQMALAMMAVITDIDRIDPIESITVACEAPADDLLLIDWLNRLVYEMAVRNMLFRRFKVTIEDHRLTARAEGEPVNRAKHEPAVEVKGATLTALEFGRTAGGGWSARCVVDV